jgi:N-acetylmuramoyl-L-alanine amidase
MITLAWYLLKVIICSGILCGYYFLALRNKVFHRWNRFYLLAAIVISLIAPVMKINIFQNRSDEGTVIQVLQTISYGDEAVVEYSKNSGFQISTENLAESAYLLVSVIFLTVFFVSLFKIKKLKKKYAETKIEDISFVNTNEKGTPFSFFKSIFWNSAIDLHSTSGQQIFNHEIAHIKEKHSYDKMFMNMVLIFFWINPFFWLMRKELYMIHEFVADKEALEDSDVNALAEMILETVYPGQHFSIGNSFFYSPLKRRIMMLAKNKNPKVNYYSRLLVLPLAAIVFFAFTLKINSANEISSYNGKTFTVVIDAGHGGSDNGAHSANGLKEKDITLSIAKKIASLNSNDHVQILLSRDNDQSISVKDRVHFAKDHDADLFVSIHLNAAADEQLNGFSVLIDRNNTEKNQLLASALINELKETYKTNNEIEVGNRGLFVVDSNSCPAALIECGYLTNSNDLAFISNNANQEKVAKDVLAAINNYASSEADIKVSESVSNIEQKSSSANDTIPRMYYHNKKVTGLQVHSKSNKVRVTEPVIKVTYDDGTTEMISKNEADKRGFVLPPPPPPGLPPSYFKSKALFVINGKISSSKEAEKIDPNEMKEINVLKDGEAISKYGDKGKNGVIEITTENTSGKVTMNNIDIVGKSQSEQKDTTLRLQIISKVFTKTEIPASFPGGKDAWQQYITRQIQASLDSFTNADFGTCVVKFIVGTNGTVIGAQAITMLGTHLAEVAVNAIKNGPKWIPAKQNGHDVAAYTLQPVTLKNPDSKQPSTNTEADKKSTSVNTAKVPDMVFTKLEQTATFPGGEAAWLKYISGTIQKSGNELIADKNSEGICRVRFKQGWESK